MKWLYLGWLSVIFVGSSWAQGGGGGPGPGGYDNKPSPPIPVVPKPKLETPVPAIPQDCKGYGYGELDMFVRGDANTDGEVDLSDAITILNTLFTGKAKLSCEDAADTNDDGELDLSDAVFLLGFLFRGGEFLPYPSPGQFGSDHTLKDTLRCESYQSDIPQAGILAHLVEKVIAGKLQVILGFCFQSKEEYVPLDYITFPVEAKTALPKASTLSNFILADVNGEIISENPVVFFHENNGSWTVNFPNDWIAQSNHSYALWAHVSSELNEGDIIIAQIDTTVIGLHPPYRLGPQNYIMGGPTTVERPKLTIKKDPVDKWIGLTGPRHSGSNGGNFILQTRGQDIALKIRLHIRQINPHSYGDPEDYIKEIFLISWDGKDPNGYKKNLSVDLPMDQMREDQHAEIEMEITVPAHANTKVGILFNTHWNAPEYTATGQQFQFSFGQDDIRAVNAVTGNKVTVDVEKLAFHPATFYNSLLDVRINEFLNEKRVEGGELISGRGQPLYRYGISSHVAVSGLYRNSFLLEGTKNVSIENLRLSDGKRMIAFENIRLGSVGFNSHTWKILVSLQMRDTSGKDAVYVVPIGPQFEKQLYITLVGDIVIADSSSAFLSIRMLGDEEFPKVFPNSAAEAAWNFIWTDFALSGPVDPWSDPGVLIRKQWTDGLKVQGLYLVENYPVVFRN